MKKMKQKMYLKIMVHLEEAKECPKEAIFL
jgi:hypothetical protein